VTDLATQPHAGKPSGDDAVGGEQDVDSEATATAGSAQSSAMDEKDAVTHTDVVTEDSVEPETGDEVLDEGETGSAEAQETDAVAEAADQDTPETEAAEADAPESEAEPADAEPAATDSDAEATEADEADADAPDASADVEADADVPEAVAPVEPAAEADVDAQDADVDAPDEAASEAEISAADVDAAEDADAPEDIESTEDADIEQHAATEDDAAPELEADLAADGGDVASAEIEAAPEAEAVVDTEPEAVVETDTEPEADSETTVGSGADLETVAVATAVLAPAPAAPSPAASTTATQDDGSVYAWAPAEPKPKKKRTGLWIGVAAGVAVVGLVVTSLLLIAPGTAVAGVPVGWMTPGAAAEAIEQRLAETTVVLTGAGEDTEITGAELGAEVDAQALADAAFAEHPMWNPTAWFAANDAEVALDASTATAALRDAAPQLYTEPVDATLAFDAATASYVATPAVAGAGVDVATVQAAIQAAFTSGQTRVEVEPVPAPIPAAIPTETADATVAQLNGMLDTVGFYVGDERTVPVDRAVAASWLSIAPQGDQFAITADPAAIQPVVDTLAAAVDRAPENAIVITDTGGKVLQTIAAGQSGRQLEDASGIAADFAGQLASGDAVFKLPVAEVPVSTTTLARNIVVDLSEQRTYIYENGQLVNSFLISSGAAATPTHTGNFRINSHIREQDMGALCYNPNAVNSYCTKDVPWVMYFNGDQGFHGTYWHNNFGNRMSHGCVNLPLGTAESLYSWAPNGTEVRVQS